MQFNDAELEVILQVFRMAFTDDGIGYSLPTEQLHVVRDVFHKLPMDRGEFDWNTMSYEKDAPTEEKVYEEFDPYTDTETKAMLERAGIATHRYRR